MWKFKCAVVKGQKSSLAKRSNTEQHKGGKENIVKAEWPTLSRIKNSRLNNCSCFLLPVPEAPRRPRSVLFTSLLLLPTFPHTHTPTEGTVRSQHSSPRPHWALTRRLLLQPPPPPPLPLGCMTCHHYHYLTAMQPNFIPKFHFHPSISVPTVRSWKPG